MDLTITYRERTFVIRAYRVDDGWTEAIGEVVREGETAEWDGSCLAYGSAERCLSSAVYEVLITVDDDAEGAR